MSRALRDVTACREALARLPDLDLWELRQQWRALYKSDASPHLSRELLLRAVAYRMQEVALGGLRPERQRQLRQIAQQFNQTGEISQPARLELSSLLMGTEGCDAIMAQRRIIYGATFPPHAISKNLIAVSRPPIIMTHA
jgi:hypothetical protein